MKIYILYYYGGLQPFLMDAYRTREQAQKYINSRPEVAREAYGIEVEELIEEEDPKVSEHTDDK